MIRKLLVALCLLPVIAFAQVTVLQKDKILLKNPKSVVMFKSDRCGPCIRAAPAFKNFADAAGSGVKAYKIDINESPDLKRKYKIRATPTYVYFKKGEEIDRKLGGMTKKELYKWLEKMKG